MAGVFIVKWSVVTVVGDYYAEAWLWRFERDRSVDVIVKNTELSTLVNSLAPLELYLAVISVPRRTLRQPLFPSLLIQYRKRTVTCLVCRLSTSSVHTSPLFLSPHSICSDQESESTRRPTQPGVGNLKLLAITEISFPTTYPSTLGYGRSSCLGSARTLVNAPTGPPPLPRQ